MLSTYSKDLVCATATTIENVRRDMDLWNPVRDNGLAGSNPILFCFTVRFYAASGKRGSFVPVFRVPPRRSHKTREVADVAAASCYEQRSGAVPLGSTLNPTVE
jgi:hypothetical protein